jgi:cellulose synthase/poly-beta-1,6-N-acetylglucosamine synthase-like glycosyltransferase/spore germination protein YaaH/peptidoglycan/xylan/chitin deacetylase (PgdA/CDA1 family)
MIFEDPTCRRWMRTIQIGILLGIAASAVLSCIVLGIFRSPHLPKFDPVTDRAIIPSGDLVDDDDPKVTTAPPASNGFQKQSGGSMVQATRYPLLTKPWITSAFVVQDDPRSVADLEARIGKLDIVFPDWYSFSRSSGRLERKVNPRTQRALAEGGAAVLPRLSNTDETGAWHGNDASKVLKDWNARSRLIAELVTNLLRDHADGINIDIEALKPGDRENLLDWLQDLAGALHKEKLSLTVDIPLNDDAFDYEAIGRIADAVVVMAYDEHFPTGSPGSISGKGWFEDGIDGMIHRIPTQKILVALGGYGYDWNTSRKKEAEALGFDNVMALAVRYNADIQTDTATVNSTFSYREESGDEHKVWFLDAVSAWNQMLGARSLGVRGMSLWRLGLEESALWEYMSLQSPDNFDPHRLSTVKLRNVVALEGKGEILDIGRSPSNGERELSFDGRSIDYAAYNTLPTCFSIKRYGHDSARRVALTFDDGPDPVWTTLILQLLRKHNVPATFFVVGDQAERFPKIVRRIYDEGHLLGNHTFSHPNIETISDMRLQMELNLTERVIESITGHTTMLFRSPFDTDSSPARPSVLHALANATSLGYVTVCADIDSEDYARPGADRIVENVVMRLRQTGSNIIVMHDGGGDRRQTVEALDRIIPLLKQEGFEFVAVDRLMGIPRDKVMSKILSAEQVIAASGGVLIWMRTWGWKILEILFLSATTIAILRIFFVGYFAVRLRRGNTPSTTAFHPPIAVIIPAFNEAKVIRRTLDTLLASYYPHISVLLVDDGSTDDTALIVAEMACLDPRVRLLSQPNAGKHAALNRGFREVKEEFIVTIDADTLVLPHTISRLIAPFVDPHVDAVCGNVQVGNVKNLLTAFQDVEYVTSQNYDRRAFDSLNCISVVPGATGAWRRSKVLRVGGYSAETLTEDADLTLSVLKAGGRIVYAPEARSITEAPESPRPLFKQRFRWSFGTFQCLWKHRRQFCHGTLGWVAMPNLLIFQVVFPLLSPIGDIVFVWSLLRGEFGAVVVGYLTFVLLDLVASLIAFRLDHRPMNRLSVVLLQRLYYRQFMYVVTFNASLAALRGGRHGWNKLERRGSVLAMSCSPNLTPNLTPKFSLESNEV